MLGRNFFSSEGWLRSESDATYSKAPLPTDLDGQIAEGLRNWMKLRVEERFEAVKALDSDGSWALLCFSERMATLAVRERNRELVLLGLVALGIEGGRFDWRENLLILCLHFDAAKRIEGDAGPVFREASAWLEPKIGTELLAFLDRPPETRSLKVMGFEVSSDRDGFRYVRLP